VLSEEAKVQSTLEALTAPERKKKFIGLQN